jgi:hypothetical protein
MKDLFHLYISIKGNIIGVQWIYADKVEKYYTLNQSPP